MSTKPNSNKGIGRSSRGGVHSSRAKRLSDKVEQNTGSGSKWLYLLSGAAVLGAAGLLYNSMSSSTEALAAETPADAPVSEIAEQVAAQATDNSETIDNTVAQSASVATAAVAPTVAGSATSQDVAAAPRVIEASTLPTVPVGQPFCVTAIERSLSTLHATFLEEQFIPWSYRQDEVTKLVQQVIDCQEVGLDVTGNLELLELGLADLEIDWDRAEYFLQLKTVPTSTEQATGELSDPGGDGNPWTSFILR